MWRKRSLQVKMVKDPEIVEAEPLDYEKLAELITRSVSTCIAVYIGGDIVRRAVIYTLSAKI